MVLTIAHRYTLRRVRNGLISFKMLQYQTLCYTFENGLGQQFLVFRLNKRYLLRAILRKRGRKLCTCRSFSFHGKKGTAKLKIKQLAGDRALKSKSLLKKSDDQFHLDILITIILSLCIIKKILFLVVLFTCYKPL